MEYVISEELKNEIRYILDKSDKHEIVDKIDDLQSVELVAKGKIITVSGDYINWSLNQNTEDNIKIYIQNVKE